MAAGGGVNWYCADGLYDILMGASMVSVALGFAVAAPDHVRYLMASGLDNSCRLLDRAGFVWVVTWVVAFVGAGVVVGAAVLGLVVFGFAFASSS